MNDDLYPAFDELGISPSFLEIGLSARYWLASAGWIELTELTEDERKEYQSLNSDKRRGWMKTKFAGKRIA